MIITCHNDLLLLNSQWLLLQLRILVLENGGVEAIIVLVIIRKTGTELNFTSWLLLSRFICPDQTLKKQESYKMENRALTFEDWNLRGLVAHLQVCL